MNVGDEVIAIDDGDFPTDRYVVDAIAQHDGITVRSDVGGPLRSFDAETRRLTLAAEASTASRLFQVAHQIANTGSEPIN